MRGRLAGPPVVEEILDMTFEQLVVGFRQVYTSYATFHSLYIESGSDVEPRTTYFAKRANLH